MIRTPLPPHAIEGTNYRRTMAATIAAELKHAKADFWRQADPGTLPFDTEGYVERNADVAHRLPHEREAGTAAVWLLHLQTHDSDRYGAWERWTTWKRDERVSWARRRRELLHGFLKACHAYQSERAKVDQPERIAA